jgi:hypothetical protein
MEDIKTYLDEGEHNSSWSNDWKDPDNFWGNNGQVHVYYNRNCSFKLKREIWHGYKTKIIKPNDIEILTNDTPFTKAELKTALIEKWFAWENENTRQANNKGARERRAKQKEIA